MKITGAVLTGPDQQYNNSDQGPTSVIAGMHTVPEMTQSLDNTCKLNTVNMISH